MLARGVSFICIAALALLGGLAVGCGAAGPAPAPTAAPGEGKPVAFDSLDRGDSTIAGLDAATLRSTASAVFVAGSPAEAAQFAAWLTASGAARLEAVDWNAAWVVALFRGRVGSSGYGITVRSVGQVPGELRLTAQLTDPAPDQNVLTVESYPYDVILVPRQGLEVASATTWSAYDSEGMLIAQNRVP
jgi:hypothetical protein